MKVSFLNGQLLKEVYISRHEGFKVEGKKDMGVKKFLYALTQDSPQWLLKFDQVVVSFSFKENDRIMYIPQGQCE